MAFFLSESLPNILSALAGLRGERELSLCDVDGELYARTGGDFPSATAIRFTARPCGGRQDFARMFSRAEPARLFEEGGQCRRHALPCLVVDPEEAARKLGLSRLGLAERAEALCEAVRMASRFSSDGHRLPDGRTETEAFCEAASTAIEEGDAEIDKMVVATIQLYPDCAQYVRRAASHVSLSSYARSPSALAQEARNALDRHPPAARRDGPAVKL